MLVIGDWSVVIPGAPMSYTTILEFFDLPSGTKTCLCYNISTNKAVRRASNLGCCCPFVKGGLEW